MFVDSRILMIQAIQFRTSLNDDNWRWSIKQQLATGFRFTGWVDCAASDQGSEDSTWANISSFFLDGPQWLTKKSPSTDTGTATWHRHAHTHTPPTRLLVCLRWHDSGTAHLARSGSGVPLNCDPRRAAGPRRLHQFSLPFCRLLMFQYRQDAAVPTHLLQSDTLPTKKKKTLTPSATR